VAHGFNTSDPAGVTNSETRRRGWRGLQPQSSKVSAENSWEQRLSWKLQGSAPLPGFSLRFRSQRVAPRRSEVFRGTL